MIIDILKWLHLLLTLSLLGSTCFCLVLVSRKQFDNIHKLNRLMLWLLLFALLTGTLLVYPKHFTFHTPWIQSAFILVFLFGTLLSLLMPLQKKYHWRTLWGMS